MSAGEDVDTVVVGGGQAGLATAYYLRQTGSELIVLDSHTRPGETWRRRWNSLRLFTPSKFNALPGAPLPWDDFYFPVKNEIADYLEEYARKFRLPVRADTTVDSLRRENGGYLVTAGQQHFRCTNVVVATGAYQLPVVPSFSNSLDPGIVHLHSSEYREPGQLPEGTILVVGAGNSGAEIAIELSKAGRKVWLAGRDVGRIPADVLGRVLGGRPYWFVMSRVLSVDTPVGRKVRTKSLHQGTPLIHLTPQDVIDAGVRRCPRVQGTERGLPRLDDGQVLEVQGIVWATGFRPDYSWIRLPVIGDHGYPEHQRGVVPQAPGLFFVGLPFQTALTSSLIGGVGVDALYIVQQIRSRKKAPSTAKSA